MNKIKTYKLFLENSNYEYSIFDFSNDLHPYEDKEIDIKWYHKFLGEGVYERILNFVDDLFETFEGIDIEDLEMRFTDFTDEIETPCYMMYSIIYKDWYDSVGQPWNTNFNGALGMGTSIDESDKQRIIKRIVRDMVIPTISSYSYKDEINFRTTPDEIFVLDEKYNCKNFDLRNFKVYSDVKDSYRIKNILDYNIDKFFDSYLPAIYINIGSGFSTENRYKMNLREVESKLDDVLPRVFSDIPHSQIIWDSARFVRKFNDDTDIYDYRVKIVLE